MFTATSTALTDVSHEGNMNRQFSAVSARVTLVAACLLVAPSLVSAQAAGTVEVGAFGQATRFDAETTLTQDPAWGGGALLGVFVARNLAIEGSWSRGWTGCFRK